MYKLLIFFYVNIISVIYAAPITSKNDTSINDILQQLDFLKKCPALLKNNIEVHKSNGGLSHCKNVLIGITPEQIDLQHLNEFYCIGLLAADIQLCSANQTNKIPKNYDDLKTNLEKIKNEKPEKICNELKQYKLFNEIENKNISILNKWVQVLDKNLHGTPCVGLCSDIENGNTNLLCSMIYYTNNNVTYVTIPENKELLPLPKVDLTVPPTNKDNAQQKVTTSVLKEVPLNSGSNTNLAEKPTTASIVTPVNVKNNAPSFENKVETVIQPKPVVNTTPGKIETPPVNNQPEAAADKPQKAEQPVVEITTMKQSVSVQQKQKDTVADAAPVKTIQITEESKPQSVVNPNSVVEENQKVATNVESSSVSSTISGVRDDLADDYFDETDDINKENEDQLISQTNIQKEAIEILANEQDRHRIPSEDGEDMEDSNFFSYFMFVSVMFIAGYVVYHNKQKIMALLLEGRRDRNSRRRPNTASYRKLNSNLEEAVTSKCSGSASHVIY